MSAKKELLERLQQISSVQLGVSQEEITEDCTWARLGADSLDRLAMSRAIEDEFKVDIPHTTGERLNTVGETVDHLLTLIAVQSEPSDVTIEAVTTNQQWLEMLGLRTQIFTVEHGFSFQTLPGPGSAGIWHFLARENRDAIGTLSVVDTTGDHRLHRGYRLSFGATDRVARYAQLALLKPYRRRGIFKRLIETALASVIQPNGFNVGWLLYPAAQARTCVLTQSLGFSAEDPLLTTEFGRCRVLTRRETGSSQIQQIGDSLSGVETCPI